MPQDPSAHWLDDASFRTVRAVPAGVEAPDVPPGKYCHPRRSEISSVTLWQSTKVDRGTLGQNPPSKRMRPHHPASTPYTAQYGFTSESRTISSTGYLKFGTATTLVSHMPFRPPLRLKSAIGLNGCYDKRP